ncbi:MAG: response regulator, partial [Desulfobacterales bacterium]|nr:response regulator [Desulfobacterales bacterium]
HILVVDDDEGIRQMLQELFTKEGFLCAVAEDGEKALARMQDREFDVVITDLRMPGLNGLELLERIKAQSATDVMVMTGHGGDVTYAEIIEKGAHDFVHKPLHAQELLLRLKRILKERSDREERRWMEEQLIGTNRLIKKSEERYRALFDNSPVATVVVDHEARIISFNQARDSSGGRTPKPGDVMYRDFAGEHEIDMYAELMDCIRLGVSKEFPQQKYRGNYLNIRMSPFFAGAIITSHNVTLLKQSELQIRSLTQDLLKAQELERQRIARELHDNVAQNLGALKLSFETLFDKNPEVSAEIRQTVAEFSVRLSDAISKVRNMSYNMQPLSLEQLGLSHAVDSFCDDYAQTSSMSVDCSYAGFEKLTLNFDTQINIYRFVQEAMNNVHKHAAARNVKVRLIVSHPDLIIRIEDDGKGFDVKNRMAQALHEKRMGLRSMQERVTLLNGHLEIQSQKNRGTKIVARIPVT